MRLIDADKICERCGLPDADGRACHHCVVGSAPTVTPDCKKEKKTDE